MDSHQKTNKLDKRFQENPDTLNFGLSTFHTHIQFFESVLNLSYQIPTQKLQARGEQEKRIVGDSKKTIQRKFKEKLRLLVDVPKPGFGNK